MTFTLTKEDVKTTVLRSLGPNVDVLDYRLEPFASSKNGIFGNHQILIVEVKARMGDVIDVKTCTYFVKSPPESLTVRHELMDEDLFLEEINFFREIYPVMTESLDCEKWSPRCYLVKGDVLVFEDMRSQGYVVRQDVPLDEPDFLRSSLSTLARFHAASLATEAKLGKTLREAFPSAFTEKMYSSTNKFGKCTALGFETIALLAEKFGIDPSLTQPMYERACQSVKYREGKCNVVCHGDLWKNNLLLQQNGQTCGDDCIIVDFQLLRYASPACDVGMLLYLHTSPSFRRRFEFEMFDHYYSALRDALMRNTLGQKIKIPDYEALLEDYRELRLVGMAYASLYLPGIYLDPKDLEAVLNNPDMLESWFYRDRMCLIGSNIDKNPAYERKLRDILEELFDEGRRIFKG